jgi:hypothetical protein
MLFQNLSEVSQMIDSKTLLPLKEAFQQAVGIEPGAATLWRYVTTGRRGVKLRNWMIGSSRRTTVEEVLRFCEAVGSGAENVASPARKRHHQQVEAELSRELD